MAGKNAASFDGPKLENAIVIAQAWQGFTVQTKDGKPATLAIIDEDGRILESGPNLVEELWDIAIMSYRRFLIGKKALRVCSTPTGLFRDDEEEG